MDPIIWYKDFLSSRELSEPSGNPLYEYKVKGHEFASLVEVLKNSSCSLLHYDSCFVLYATEWWRKEYAGGHWSWDPIFGSINKTSIKTQERNNIIEKGFNSWGRKIYTNNQGRDFIGTVVIECGIPLNILRSGHYLSEIISESYRELGSISSIQYEYLEFVRIIAVKKRIPDSLNRDPFLHLILEFVRKLVNLNNKYDLSKEDKPVEYLDIQYAEWRNEFPIRIENNIAKNFLDNLLSHVAKIEKPEGYAISTFHELIKCNGIWKCQAYLSIKSGIHKYTSLGIQENEYNELTNKSEIFIDDKNGERRIGFAFKILQNNAYRIDGLDKYLVNDDSKSHNWSLFMLDPRSGKRIELETLYNDILSFNEPLIFSRTDSQWFLKSTGSARLSGDVYRIIVNSNAQMNCDNIVEIGELSDGRKIIEIKSDCEITENNNLFRIRLSNQNQSFRYEFHPANNHNSLSFYKKDNKDIYLGFPKVYQFREDGNLASRIISGLEYNVGNVWKKVSNDIFGRLKIRFISDGETLFCRTISVLPSDFKVEYRNTEGGGSPKRVAIMNVSNLLLNVKGEVNSKIFNKEPENRLIEFIDLPNQDAPEFFRIGLQNVHLSNEVLVMIPYPKNEVQFYDGQGRKLKNRSSLYIHKLHGVRLSITNLNPNVVNQAIEIRLVDSFNEDISLRKTIKVEAYSNENISLITFQQQLTKLFTLTKNIDAWLELSCQQKLVEIRQFVSKPYFAENGYLSIKTEDIAPDSIKVRAFRLDKAFLEEDIIDLEYVYQKGTWSFPYVAGKWLIYPAKESSQLFRPIAFKSPDTPEVHFNLYSELHEAAMLSKEQRMETLSQIIDSMSIDFSHPDWDRLCLLNNHTNHLPLATMDIWKVLSQHPKGLIAASLRLPEGLVKQLTDEFSIIWYQYPIAYWIVTFEHYKKFVNAQYPEHFELLINSVLNRVESLLELTSVKWIIEKVVFNSGIENRQAFQNLDAVKILVELNLNGEEGSPGVRGRHDRQPWPDQLNEIVVPLFKKLHQDLIYILPQGLPRFQQSVIYLPFILAIASTSSKYIILPEFSPKERLRIQEVIEFDEDWFKQTYDFIKGYSWLQFTT
jgi:hypothetical protein